MCNNRFAIGVIRWKILQETFKERLSCSNFLFVNRTALEVSVLIFILGNEDKEFQVQYIVKNHDGTVKNC